MTLCSRYLLNNKTYNTCLLTMCFYRLCTRHSFFPYTIKEWNNLSPEIRSKSVSYEVFKNSLLKFTIPTPNNLFNQRDIRGLLYHFGLMFLIVIESNQIESFRLEYFREHKFNHDFQEVLQNHRPLITDHQPIECSCADPPITDLPTSPPPTDWSSTTNPLTNGPTNHQFTDSTDHQDFDSPSLF